jgi:hypothetical protein
MHRDDQGRHWGLAVVALSLPFVVHFAVTHLPSTTPVLAFASLIFVVGCAIVLRSLTIVGAMLGIVFGSIMPPQGTDYIPSVEAEVKFVLVFTIAGALAGIVCQAAVAPKRTAEPGKRDEWTGPLAVTAVLAAAFSFFAWCIFAIR